MIMDRIIVILWGKPHVYIFLSDFDGLFLQSQYLKRGGPHPQIFAENWTLSLNQKPSTVKSLNCGSSPEIEPDTRV